MTFPRRRLEDQDGGISHMERHNIIDNRLSDLERRQLYITVLLTINTALTGLDIASRINPIFHALTGIASWSISLLRF
jgi:hypothetical protein